MKLLTSITFLAALALGCGAASAQSIGVYFDFDATSCSASHTGPGPFTWYIIAHLGGPAARGISGAEFRQDGTPAGWSMTASPNSGANVVIGDPLAGGTNIAFPSCEPGYLGTDRVPLFTVSGSASTPAVPRTYLRIIPHTKPSNPKNPCPILVLCDYPVYTLVCVPGGAAIINGGHCTVASVPTSWSKVKGLYD